MDTKITRCNRVFYITYNRCLDICIIMDSMDEETEECFAIDSIDYPPYKFVGYSCGPIDSSMDEILEIIDYYISTDYN